ncbi:MAG: hypothetical protein IKB61_02715 [Elusimicrobiaceae bacterium]|nr:hypothetical protein [Elusimicrobiaceae bacterium]
MDLGFTLKDIIVVIFIAGGLYAKLQAIGRDIKRLEKKQDRYNNLQERTLKLEVWSQMHEKECGCQTSGKEAKN